MRETEVPLARGECRNTIFVEVAESARKHGVADPDIEHAVRNAMMIIKQGHDRRIYLGPARDAQMLEVITVIRDRGRELAIHAMPMRRKYHEALERSR